MQPTQRTTKDWIRQVAEFLGISVSDLARRSKVAPSTLTRYVNDASGTVGITQRTLDAVAAYSGVPVGQSPGAKRTNGFGEADAVPLAGNDPDLADWLIAAAEVAKQNRPGRDAWVMKGRALDAAGVLPGDVLIIDLNLRPRSGDTVCAQIYDHTAGRAETVIRIYEPPYLLAASTRQPISRPIVVDDDTVAIRGVVAGVLRARV